MDITEIVREVTVLTDLAYNSDMWLAVSKAVKNVGVP
jgi:hypothetical protein